MQGGRWLGQVLGPARSPSGSMCLCGRSSARSSAPPVHVGCMDGLQASHARRGAAGQIAAGFQLSVRAHLSPAALVRVGLGVRPGHVGLSCVTEITRMVFFARVTPLNPTWTGPNAPHALKSAFRATHTTSHSACVAARGTDRRHPGAPARHGARGPPAGANVSEPHRRERCDPSRMKVKRLDLRYSLIGVVGTAPLEHGELHRSAKVVGAGLLRFLLLKALLSLD